LECVAVLGAFFAFSPLQAVAIRTGHQLLVLLSAHNDNLFLAHRLQLLPRLIQKLPRLDRCRVSLVFQWLNFFCVRGTTRNLFCVQEFAAITALLMSSAAVSVPVGPNNANPFFPVVPDVKVTGKKAREVHLRISCVRALLGCLKNVLVKIRGSVDIFRLAGILEAILFQADKLAAFYVVARLPRPMNIVQPGQKQPDAKYAMGFLVPQREKAVPEIRSSVPILSDKECFRTAIDCLILLLKDNEQNFDVFLSGRRSLLKLLRQRTLRPHIRRLLFVHANAKSVRNLLSYLEQLSDDTYWMRLELLKIFTSMIETGATQQPVWNRVQGSEILVFSFFTLCFSYLFFAFSILFVLL
jgi:hypothetical protein